MRNESNTQRRRRGIFLLICFLLPGISSQFAAAQSLVKRDSVGKVTGMASTATQNGVRSNLQNMVRAHDTLITDSSGRLRLQLLSGTILNVGSSSQLQILDYDPVSQATTVELKGGRLRSRVAKLPSATGTFEVLTPYAKVTALGGDFSVEVDPTHTRVLVHSGVVVMASAPSDPAKLALDLVAGQTAIADARGIGALELTPDDLEQQSLTATLVPDTPPSAPVSVAVTEAPATKPRSHLQRNLLIVLAIAGGGAAAAVLAGHGGGGSSSTAQPPPSIPTIPGH